MQRAALVGTWPIHREKKSHKDFSVQSPRLRWCEAGKHRGPSKEGIVRSVGPWAVLQRESCSQRQIRENENEEPLSPVNIFGVRQSCTNCPSAASLEVLKPAQIN